MSFELNTIPMTSGTLPYWTIGDGAPLLYLHPAGGVIRTPFLEKLAQTRKIYIPVIPGFDGTPRHEGVSSVPDVARLIAEFTAETIGGKTDVMGVSFGGWVALWLAAMSPELVDLLVLEAPAGLRFGMDATTLSPEAARANLFAYPDKAKPYLPPRDQAIANGARFAAYGAGLFVDDALKMVVPTIEAPTFVLMGALDITIPAATGQFLATAMPRASVTYIYDAAHALEMDQPERTLKAVRPFLARGQAFIVNRPDSD